MPLEDAVRWNARYSTRSGTDKDYAPRPFLIEHREYLPPEGFALDIAAGLGGSANFLISAGLGVIGVDISEVSIRRCKARFPAFQGVVADLTTFYLPENKFDVILNFYYLQREMWPAVERSLRPGGVLFFETMTDRMLAANPHINPDHLLGHGELVSAFPSLETLLYEEFNTEEEGRITYSVARLIARKS